MASGQTILPPPPPRPSINTPLHLLRVHLLSSHIPTPALALRLNSARTNSSVAMRWLLLDLLDLRTLAIWVFLAGWLGTLCTRLAHPLWRPSTMAWCLLHKHLLTPMFLQNKRDPDEHVGCRLHLEVTFLFSILALACIPSSRPTSSGHCAHICR